jgi:hypothetical protein
MCVTTVEALERTTAMIMDAAIKAADGDGTTADGAEVVMVAADVRRCLNADPL